MSVAGERNCDKQVVLIKPTVPGIFSSGTVTQLWRHTQEKDRNRNSMKEKFD